MGRKKKSEHISALSFDKILDKKMTSQNNDTGCIRQDEQDIFSN